MNGKRARKSKKGGRIEPKVKVVSPVVDAVTGKVEATPEGQVETAAVLALFYFFLLILVEGLLLAGSVSSSRELENVLQPAECLHYAL